MSEQVFDPPAGAAQTLAPGLVRVLAPNPSPMTFRGTNSFLLGEAELVVIDPGPDLPAHLAALQAAIAGRTVRAILVTHAHRDHSPLARPLATLTGAPVMAFGTAAAGRSTVMAELAASGLAGGGEGVDAAFSPDLTLADGALLTLAGEPVEALHTPGHMGNHLCFAWRGHMFCGDLVMGWASTLISPPDGDLGAFYESCARLRARTEPVFHPAHGAPIQDPRARIDWLVAHRRAREAQILATLASGPADIAALTATIYADTDPALMPAAARNVLAHLIDLHARGVVTAEPHLAATARFTLAPPRPTDL